MVLMLNEIMEQPEVLTRCLESNAGVIKGIVDAIGSREITAIVIAARGTSDHAGVYAKYLMESVIGLPVALAAPSVFTIYKKKMDFSKCLVLGVSQSGKAEDVLEVIKGANRCGAVTVSITNDLESPLASEAQHHLYCSAGIEKSVAATKTFTSEMYLLAQLVAEWSGDVKLKSELASIPSNITEILKNKQSIFDKVERYRFINECFVLSRGINYSIAMETALKIQETSYVRARAYATSDFQHGPFAMIQRDMPVMIFAPNGPSLADAAVMIDKLKASEADVFVVSNNEEILMKGDSSFQIPQTSNDMISPFYNIVVAQLFACKLSLTKGLNPDAPRGLNKVTITR